MALFRFAPGDCCREASGCRLGQRPCMTRTPQRTGGRHTELLQLARSPAEHTATYMRGLRELRYISIPYHVEIGPRLAEFDWHCFDSGVRARAFFS